MTQLNDHSAREHALLSASSAHRWLACPPSAVAAEAYPPQDTEYTREGTLAHEVAEAEARYRLDNDEPLWPKTITTEMIDCAKGYADHIQEYTRSDGSTVLLERRVDFSPWVPDGFGTCDCIILQDETMIVIDYKYGVGVPVSSVGNPQLRLYALGALNDYGVAYDVKTVEMHIYQPRANNVGVDTISVEDLLAWAEETVKPTAQLAAKGEGEYSAGEHCRFCPHAGKCRELMWSCKTFVETHDVRAEIPTLAPWEVADVLRMETQITNWLDKVKKQALHTMQNGGEIPGYKVVAGRSSREWVDELRVQERLLAADYSKEDITKTELLSVSKMEKKLGKKKAATLLVDLIEKKAGAPTIALETDKRPAYDRLAEARKDFEDSNLL